MKTEEIIERLQDIIMNCGDVRGRDGEYIDTRIQALIRELYEDLSE